MEHISVMLWNTLSLFIGLEEQVYIRRRKFDLIDKILKRVSGIRVIYSRSRAEGLSLRGSDVDMMYVLDKISVTENPNDLDSDMIMDTNNIKPGFVKLHCLKKFGMFGNAMTQIPEGIFLSSLLFRDETVRVLLGTIPSAFAHGPCATFKTPIKIEADFLLCFLCKTWPQKESEWIGRGRRGWPSPDLIRDVVHDGCLLVPVGNPYSNESHMQWRISFSLAEKKLVHSFNHTQFLCYGLLKLFLRHAINTNVEVKDLLCSYFLKTSLFYCIEEENIVWSKENFLDCFWTCFRRLMKWVRDEYCPNYFIKDNNMFEGKVCGSKRRTLLDHLFKLYNDGIYSLRLIPCLSELHLFETARSIPTNTTHIENIWKEYLCDIEILLSVSGDSDPLDLNFTKNLDTIIDQMIQNTTNPIDLAILTLMSFNSVCNNVPSVYETIQTTRSI